MHAYRDPRIALTDQKDILERELESVDAELRTLDAEVKAEGGSILDRVQIASPCPVKWEDMVGDDTQRACAQCKKDVYNVSSMTRVEAETFLEANIGLDACIQFYRRRDGTIVTSECAPRRKRVYLIVGGISAVVVLAGLTTLNNTANSAADREAGRPSLPSNAAPSSAGK